jgi:hypothetical protein
MHYTSSPANEQHKELAMRTETVSIEKYLEPLGFWD